MNQQNHHPPDRLFPFLMLLLVISLLSPPLGAQTDAFQVIVHDANPANEISVATASKIFMRKLSQWPTGVVAVPLNLVSNSPVRAEFSRQIHNKSSSSIDSYWQRHLFSGRAIPPDVMTQSEVLAAVRATPGGIAYVGADVQDRKSVV